MVGLADLKKYTDNIKRCYITVNNRYCYFQLTGMTIYDFMDILNYKSWIYKTYQKSVTVRYVNVIKNLEKGSARFRTSVGFAPLLMRFLRSKGFQIRDEDIEPFRARNVVFPDLKIRLYDFQERIANDWINVGGIGVLKVPTGGGKTLLGCKAIKEIGRKTLILVHTSDLLINVWNDSLIKSFGPGIMSQVGIVGGGLSDSDRMAMKVGVRNGSFYENIRNDIVIATFQTMVNRLDELSQYKFGLLIVDECIPIDSDIWTKDGIIKYKDLGYGYEYKNDIFQVWSRNSGDNIVNNSYKKIKTRMKHMYRTIVETGDELVCSLDHKVLSRKKDGSLDYIEIEKVKNIARSLIRPYGYDGSLDYIEKEKESEIIRLYLKYKERNELSNEKDICSFDDWKKKVSGDFIFLDILRSEYRGYEQGYTLTVDNDHNYLVNGYVLRNCHHVPSQMFRKVNAAIKAPYKMGLSVSGDTFIPIIRNYKIEIARLEDLCCDVGENEIKDVSDKNLYCFSFDENYDIRKSKISHLHKYMCDKEMFMVKLQNGRNIKITSDHSLFKLEGNEIKEIRGSDIRKGDYLVIPKRINFPGIVNKIQIIGLLLESKYARYNEQFMSKKINIDIDGQTFDRVFKLIDYGYICEKKRQNWYIANKWISQKRYIPLDVLCDFRNSINLDLFRNGKVSFSSDEDIKIDCILSEENSKKLAYLLGAFAGDGWFKGEYGVGFSIGNDTEFGDKICRYMKDLFNFESKMYKSKDNNFEILIDSKLIYNIIDMFGVYDEEKKKIVPSLIFYCDNDIRKEYINGLIDSDGYNKQDYQRSDLRITNTSKKLIYGVMFIAHFEEDVWTLTTRKYVGGGLPHITAEGITHDLLINGNISNTLGDDYKNPNREFSSREQSDQIISMYPNNENLRLLLDKIKNRKGKTEYPLFMSKKDVLDRKRFNDEEFDILLGRLLEEEIIQIKDYLKFKWIKQSDFCFAEVKDIHRVDRERYVYDITTDFENFIGNGILCHNSATTKRLDGLEKDVFSQLGSIQSSITIRELINKGILAEPRFQSPVIVDRDIIEAVESSGLGGLNLSRYVKKMSASSEKKKDYIINICKNIAARDRKFLLFTDYVAAEEVYIRDMYADSLLREGIRVSIIDQEMSSDERSNIFKFLDAGQISGIVFGKLGSEGVNIPSVDAVVMANGLKSPITYCQRVGRAMRRVPGKQWCDIYEVLLDIPMELRWSEFNFEEYRLEGFQKLVYKVE